MNKKLESPNRNVFIHSSVHTIEEPEKALSFVSSLEYSRYAARISKRVIDIEGNERTWDISPGRPSETDHLTVGDDNISSPVEPDILDRRSSR